MKKNDPVQTLMNEHQIIGAAQQTILSLRDTWGSAPEAYRERVSNLIAFFREYSDGFHHHKEEAVLFRELRANPDFLLDGILDELENHHEMFRETVADIEGLIREKNWPGAQRALEQYMEELLDHIAVENDELFIMAESLFGEEDLERIYFLFEDIDRDLGAERKREWEKSLI
ncbi:MAG: hemerythrin domain-containing protein [Saprospiraceae bacterium]